MTKAVMKFLLFRDDNKLLNDILEEDMEKPSMTFDKNWDHWVDYYGRWNLHKEGKVPHRIS